MFDEIAFLTERKAEAEALAAQLGARLAALTAPPPVVAAPAVPARLRRFGVFAPFQAGPGRLPAYVQWLGRSPGFISDNANETNDWLNAMSSWQDLIWKYGATPATIVLGLPILPRNNAGQFKQANAGAFDANLRKMAEAAKPMLDRTVGGTVYTIYIRPGWEFNGNWMPWFASNPADFIAYWRRFVGIFREVDPRFQFVWCSTLGQMHMDTFAAYPGDDVVDVICTDVYDEAWDVQHRTDVALRWKDKFLNGKFGLTAFADFAAKHSKPRAFTEWGLRNLFPPKDYASGGDNPYFIEQMAAQFDALGDRLAFQCYFERSDQLSSLSAGKSLSDGNGGWTPTPTLFPKGAVRYRELFGPQA
ncbi:glycoside hydrolase family 26 protein [Methylobacterium flocculans]|uniref:glycoside hydrolase family 26 protein n=1 Tax=Methylobacterium flocculans TaxID=2984843 RepID=UPI0021F27B86|nr:glycosyl hydrolase [Methylobacterium sp. FF17]